MNAKARKKSPTATKVKKEKEVSKVKPEVKPEVKLIPVYVGVVDVGGAPAVPAVQFIASLAIINYR